VLGRQHEVRGLARRKDCQEGRGAQAGQEGREEGHCQEGRQEDRQEGSEEDREEGHQEGCPEEGSEEKIDYFIKPVNGFISRGFNTDKGHIGIDFVVKVGSPVYAAANGYVVFADYTSRDGYMMIINHTNDYITVYKHCSILLKKIRDRVFQGELISLSGNSGEITTGPHLHFEIWKQGQPINPKNVFSNK